MYVSVYPSIYQPTYLFCWNRGPGVDDSFVLVGRLNTLVNISLRKPGFSVHLQPCISFLVLMLVISCITSWLPWLPTSCAINKVITWYLAVWFFSLSHSCGYMLITHYGFNLHFFDVQYDYWLFYVLICLFRSFAHFMLYWVVYFAHFMFY